MQKTTSYGIQRVSLQPELNTALHISGPCVITCKKNGRLSIDADASVSIRTSETLKRKKNCNLYHLENIRPQ